MKAPETYINNGNRERKHCKHQKHLHLLVAYFLPLVPKVVPGQVTSNVVPGHGAVHCIRVLLPDAAAVRVRHVEVSAGVWGRGREYKSTWAKGGGYRDECERCGMGFKCSSLRHFTELSVWCFDAGILTIGPPVQLTALSPKY